MSQPFQPPSPVPTSPPQQPYAQQPYSQPYAQQSYQVPAPSNGQAPPGARRSTHPIAVTALVLSIAAIVLVMLAVVGGLVASGFFDSGYILEGTAPQVVAGQPYAGTDLADEVRRVIERDGGDVTSMTCESTPEVGPGAETTCDGEVDGWEESVSVTFDDERGHFSLIEED